MRVITLCVVLSLLSIGCADPPSNPKFFIIKKTGERVVWGGIEDGDFKTVKVGYLSDDNRRYGKIVKEEDIIPEEEYQTNHSDELEYERLKKKLGK